MLLLTYKENKHELNVSCNVKILGTGYSKKGFAHSQT